MAEAAAARAMTAAEYLAWERTDRRDGNAWRYRELGPGDRLELSNGAAIAVDAVYEGAFELEAG